ncbi:MAG: hypothetical protein FWC00_05800 [Firmicutes bacterium]|nr:hypothetical protein [Bacillota bacterium]
MNKENAEPMDTQAMAESLVNKDRDKNLPNIKRMLETLDKFLDRRIAGIALLFMTVLVACGAGLIANGSNVYAATGGQTTVNTLGIWLYSILAVFTFLFVLVIARVITFRNRKKT